MLKYVIVVLCALLVSCAPYPYSRTGVYYNYSPNPTYYSYTPIYTPEPIIYPRTYPYPYYYSYHPIPHPHRHIIYHYDHRRYD